MLIALYSQGHLADAQAMARTMTSSYPKHVLGWKVLGACLKKQGRTAESLQPMQKAAVLSPQDHEAINNLGVTLQDLGKLEQAMGCFKEALRLKPDYADAHGNLGDALRQQGKLEAALQSYQRKLALVPGDASTLHHVDALSGRTTQGAPQAYVEGVFNHYAPHFDTHLTGALRYDMPQRIAQAIASHAAPAAADGVQRLLDLGCGTGLVGQALPEQGFELVGVDLASGMLERARLRQRYQRLVQADLVGMMQGEPDGSHDIVTSADVFIYVGNIDASVQEVRRLLKPGGLFVFSVESFLPEAGSSGQDYRLETSGRYAHAAAYLDRLASRHGFAVVQRQDVDVRFEQNKAIKGWLDVWRA